MRLLNDGWKVTLAARRIEQAEQLAQSFHKLPITNYQLITDLQPSTFDLIVNTTPLGMSPNIDNFSLPENIVFSDKYMLFMIWSTIHVKRNWSKMPAPRDCLPPLDLGCSSNKPPSPLKSGLVTTRRATFYGTPLITDTLILLETEMPLRFLTAGESHGPSLTAILDGMPAGLPITPDIINKELARRQQGYGSGGRMKIEKDTVQILGRRDGRRNHRRADCLARPKR